MAATVAEWVIALKDEMSGNATKAAKALEELRQSIKGEKSELADLQRQMRELKRQGGDGLKASMQELKGKIDAKRESIKQAKLQYKSLADSTATLKGRSSALKAIFGELGQATRKLPGPLGEASSSIQSLVSKMGGGRAVTMALAAGFAAVAAAAAFATSKLLGAAIASQNARRNELLHFEALTKQRNLWGILPGKATDMQRAVDSVSASVSISRDKVSGFASQLYNAGLRGNKLTTVLEATSIKASALGEGAGSAFAGWASALAVTGGNVKRLSDDIKNRFGGVVAKQMKSLEVSQLKMQEGFASLFTDLDIEPFLDGMTQLRGMFSQSTESGRALKALVTDLLKPLLGSATDGLVTMRRFFKQMIIGALEIEIAFMTVRNWFLKTFGSGQVNTLSRLFGSFQAGRVFVYALAAGFGVLAVNVIAATWPILAVAAGIWGIITLAQQLSDLWNEIDWTDMGAAIWKGIVGGVKSGWSAVTTVFSDMAGEAKRAFAQALGIESPSKVFAKLGGEIPAGVKLGVEQRTPEAQSAVDSIVTPKLGTAASAGAAAPTAPSAPASPSGGASSTQVTIAELHVHARTDDAKGFAEELVRTLENVLSGAATQLGAAPLGAGAQ